MTEETKTPIIKDIGSTLDTFKKSQGWMEIPDKPKNKLRLKKDTALAKKVTTAKDLMKKKGSNPKPKPVKQLPVSDRAAFNYSANPWTLREEEYEDVLDIDEELYPLSKAELAQRKKEQEYLKRKKARDAAIRDQEIYNAIIKSMNKERYYPLFHGFGWMLIAKLSKLEVKRSTNSEGFQPYEKAKEEEICLLTMLNWDGDGPEEGTVAKALEEIGCPTIFVHSSQDVKGTLRKI